MSAFEKDLWNLLLQQHPGISQGNALGYLSYYFEKLVILAKFEQLKDCANPDMGLDLAKTQM